MSPEGLQVLEGGPQGPAGLHMVDGSGQLRHTDGSWVRNQSEQRSEPVLWVHTHPELLVGGEAELLQQDGDVDQVQTEEGVLKVRRAAAD